MTACIPVPCRAWCARVLQGGGRRLQPQQAKSFCQGCLYQLHLLLLHLKPPAQGLQGLLSRALTWERGKKQSECTHHLGKGLRGFSLPPAVHLSNRTCPLRAAPGLDALPEGRRRVVKDQGPPCGRAGEEPGKAPFLLPSQPPQRQGVPCSTRGKIWSTGEERGDYRQRRSAGEGRQGPAQSKLRSPEKAEKLRGSTRRKEGGTQEYSHPEDSEKEKTSRVTGEGISGEKSHSEGPRVTLGVRSKKTQNTRKRGPE